MRGRGRYKASIADGFDIDGGNVVDYDSCILVNRYLETYGVGFTDKRKETLCKN